MVGKGRGKGGRGRVRGKEERIEKKEERREKKEEERRKKNVCIRLTEYPHTTSYVPNPVLFVTLDGQIH